MSDMHTFASCYGDALLIEMVYWIYTKQKTNFISDMD